MPRSRKVGRHEVKVWNVLEYSRHTYIAIHRHLLKSEDGVGIGSENLVENCFAEDSEYCSELFMIVLV